MHLQSEPEVSGGQQSYSVLCEQGPIVHLNMVLMGHLLLVLIIKLGVITGPEQRQISLRLPLKYHCFESSYALDKSIFMPLTLVIPLCVQENKEVIQGPICDELLF